jgi:succinoglycan biosynthesis transport protein ExoP
MKMNSISLAPSSALTPLVQVPQFAHGDVEVPEQKLELLEYWRSLTKRKWLLLGLGVAAVVISSAIAMAMTPTYRSTVTVLIEPNKGKILSIQDIYADANGGSSQREQYQTQVELLKSREVAERTVRAMKLWNVPEFDPRKNESLIGMAMTAVGLRSAPKTWTDDALANATTVEIMKLVNVDAVRASQLVKVSFDSADKDLAADVANTIAAQYIEADRDSRFKVSQQASTFLQDRLKSLRDNLNKSEQALQAYREQHGMVNIGGSAQASVSQQLSATTDRLVAARARRAELEGAYQQLHSVKGGDYASSPVVMRDPAVMETSRQLNDINRRLAELGETLGPRNGRILELESQKDQLAATLRSLRADVARSVNRDYEAARATEQAIERDMNTARGGVQSVNRDEFQLATLDREAQTNRQLYDMFMGRAKEMNLSSDVQASVARVVDPAVAIDKPFRPARSQIVIISLVLTLFIAAMAMLLLDRLDTTIKSGEDAEARLKQPLLAVLPEVPDADRKHMALLLLEDPHSHFSEAIRTARTGVSLSNLDNPNKVVLITSTLPDEGKTTVAINLALAHAQTKRTLLIDCDMRRSQVGRSLRMAPGSRGLTNLVGGTAEMVACVQRFKGSDLYVMPVGDMPPNPLELLLSHRFREVLQALSTQFEVIVIDSPPIELVSEALVLAPLATSTVLVVKAMSTPAPLARKSIQRIQRAGGNILGLILNQLDFKLAQRYYGEYTPSSYTYGGYGTEAQIATDKKANSSPVPLDESPSVTSA